MDTDKQCINCQQKLVIRDNLKICPLCNSQALEESQIFIETSESSNQIYITCHGATLYHEGTTEVSAGVKWNDENDPSKGYEIISHPVYAPTHTGRRRIKKEAIGRIRRCQGCQDYTIRMRRKEGKDFFIPSDKHPRRKNLKPVEHRTYS